MKHLIVALLLLSLLSCSCIFSAYHVSRVVSDTENMLQQANAAIESNQYPQCRAYLDVALNHWEEHSQALSHLIHQNELGRVKEELAGLRATLMAGDQDDFRNSCARLISGLQHLRNMQWPGMLNFLQKQGLQSAVPVPWCVIFQPESY